MGRSLRAWLSIAMVAVPLAVAQASEVAELSHNPFSRPALPSLPSGRDLGLDDAPTGETLELRATLITPGHAMADVNGVILTVGEEVEGFRLVEVGERRAVLEREGTRLVVSLGDEE